MIVQLVGLQLCAIGLMTWRSYEKFNAQTNNAHDSIVRHRRKCERHNAYV